MEPEIETENVDLPKLCLHPETGEKTNCHFFDPDNFIDLKAELRSNASLKRSQRKVSEDVSTEETPSYASSLFTQYEDCCEYPISSFVAASDVFSNLTCSNTSSNCHVICNVMEMVSKNCTII